MSLRICIAVVLAFACNPPLDDQVRSLEIDGPKEVNPGQLVRLKAVLDPEESPFWIVLSPIDLDYEQVDGGSRLILAARCQQTESITILLLAQKVREGRIVTRQVRMTIAIRTPPRLPDEGDPVIPKLPFDESPLFSSVQLAWSKITANEARVKKELIAENFSSVANRCENGEIQSLPEIWQSISLANQLDLGQHASNWEPVGIAVQDEFKRLQLSSVQAHSFHLHAVAAALRSQSHE